jgi:hypothetical protein
MTAANSANSKLRGLKKFLFASEKQQSNDIIMEDRKQPTKKRIFLGGTVNNST